MSLFLRLLEDEDKGAALESALRALAAGEPDPRVFETVAGRQSSVVSCARSHALRGNAVLAALRPVALAVEAGFTAQTARARSGSEMRISP